MIAYSKCLFFSMLVIACHTSSLQAQSAPSYPLLFPRDGMWVIYSRCEYPNGLAMERRSIFISRGFHWRMETEKYRGKVSIALYDGQRLLMPNKSKLRTQDLDPRLFYSQVYRRIQEEFIFNGVEEINGYACWRFLGASDRGASAKIWVEIAGHMIRKSMARSLDGETITEEFFDLPEDVTIPANLFDPDNKNPVLLSQLKHWRIK